MANHNPQFSEAEKLLLLAEILKKCSSTDPSVILLRALDELRVEPPWSNIALPPDRSVADCQGALRDMRVSRTSLLFCATLTHDTHGVSPARPPFRAQEASIPTGRIIQPRPPTTTSARYEPFRGPGSHYSLSADDPNAKRRGRPPKVEVERRRREAEARGEEYPTPRASKKPKTYRSSLVPDETATAGPGSALIVETVTTPSSSSRVAASPATSSASRKRGHPPKPSDALADAASATEPQRSYGRLLPDPRNAHPGGPP